jgi:hypothetical protein
LIEQGNSKFHRVFFPQNLKGVAPGVNTDSGCLPHSVEVVIQLTKQDLGNSVIIKFQVLAGFTVEGG